MDIFLSGLFLNIFYSLRPVGHVDSITKLKRMLCMIIIALYCSAAHKDDFRLKLWKVCHLDDSSQNLPIIQKLLESLRKSVAREQQLTSFYSVLFERVNKRRIVYFFFAVYMA